MPPNVDIMLSVLFQTTRPQPKLGLHVQSRSYWAPANIGPYSQAVRAVDSKLVFVAGQIPLEPETMLNKQQSANLGSRAALALQHLWRVGLDQQVAWWTYGVAFLTTPDEIAAKEVIDTWRMAHSERVRAPRSQDDDDGPDAWDRTFGNNRYFAPIAAERLLPDLSKLHQTSTDRLHGDEVDRDTHAEMAKCFVVEVAELPRDADIEWQSLGTCSRVRLTNGFVWVKEGGWRIEYATTHLIDSDIKIILAAVPHGTTDSEGLSPFSILNRIDQMEAASCVHITVYGNQHVLSHGERLWQEAQVIPCKSVWSWKGEKCAAVLVMRVEPQ